MNDLNEAIADAVELIESIDRRNKERETNERRTKLPRKKLEGDRYRGFPRLARCSVLSLTEQSDSRNILS